MLKNKTFLAIIPARKGSKGVPGKNIKEINGKPLISLSIQEARKSKYIDKLIVTTNSKEIASIAIQAGAEAPFLRPEQLAKDDSSAASVILHALDFPSIKELDFDYFIYLQPTSPFRTAEHIDSAIENIIKNNDANSLVSVCTPMTHPYWMKTINQKGFLDELIKTESVFHNRQELPDVYAVNGAIYICKLSVFLSNKTFYKGNCIPFFMSVRSSIDIDNKNDWDYADFLFKNRK
jgi:CMP-N,N'-diacetyllegionaminic acid synthase